MTDTCCEEGLSLGNVAVLCPTNQDCRRLANEFAHVGLRAKAMMKGGVDPSFDGLKVLTMHNSKGLEFPIVAVVGLASGRMPWTDRHGSNREETDKLQRAFFVACSRAMKRLLVVADRARLSPFVRNFDERKLEGRRMTEARLAALEMRPLKRRARPSPAWHGALTGALQGLGYSTLRRGDEIEVWDGERRKGLPRGGYAVYGWRLGSLWLGPGNWAVGVRPRRTYLRVDGTKRYAAGARHR